MSSFQVIGVTGGHVASASADGSVVAGITETSGSTGYVYRWSPASGLTPIEPASPVFDEFVGGISADGAVIVGSHSNQAFRWTPSSNTVGLFGNAGRSEADGVSSDGSFVTGLINESQLPTYPGRLETGQAVIWKDGQTTVISPPGSTVNGLVKLSSDGGEAAMFIQTSSGQYELYKWFANAAPETLLVTGTSLGGRVTGISADGSTVVGVLPGDTNGFRWTSQGLTDLGPILPFAVSGNGTTIVGVGDGPFAEIWDQTNGIRNFQDVLVAQYGLGASLARSNWLVATGITPDGQTITGNGEGPDGNFDDFVVHLTSPADIAMDSASLTPDGRNVQATYTISGSDLASAGTVDFYWAKGRKLSDKLGTARKVATTTKVGSYMASTSIASLGQRPTNATYILAAADSPDADTVNNVVSVPAPPVVFPASRSWDVTNGGINFAYQVAGTLPANVPVEFFWSNSQTFDSTKDQLAASASIQAGQSSSPTYLGVIHIASAQIADPPTGTTFLLIVVDQHHRVLTAQPDGSLASLGYDPELFTASTYNGNADPNTIGRFLGAPHVITDESLTFQLSDSLAALRPVVTTQAGKSLVLVSHQKDGSSGHWDGRTYETDKFDPGVFSKPTVFTTRATRLDGTNLAAVATSLDVETLPDWLSALDDRSITFTSMPVGTTTSLTGVYTITGLIANLPIPATATIPDDVLLVGGKAIGTSATFKVVVNVPLSTSARPTVSGNGTASLTFLGNTLFTKNIDTTTPIGESGVFTLTPSFTLDPETLTADDGFGVTVTFKDKATLPDQDFYTGTRLIRLYRIPFLAHYAISADIGYDLTAQAQIVFTPGTGFALVSQETYGSLVITASLKGTVDIGYFIPIPPKDIRALHRAFPRFFSSNNRLPSLEWKSSIGGTVSVNSLVSYSGDGMNALPLLATFRGSLAPKVESQIGFMIGNRTIFGTRPLDFTPLIFPDFPRPF